MIKSLTRTINLVTATKLFKNHMDYNSSPSTEEQ